jgi:ABC-2 type transport system permease protein
MTTRGLVGMWPLMRLALRRDRITVPIWILLLGIAPSTTVGGYNTFYPTHAARVALTNTIGRNPSVAVLYGRAFDLSTPGGFTAWRTGGFIALFIGLMAVFTVTRHTRAEEDSGRAELIASAAVGRYALLAAGVAVAAGASVVIGGFEAGALVGAGLPASGSVAFGLAIAGTGLVFTAVAALACQLAEYSRTANGIGAGALGLAFLLRAVGDSSASLRWLSWLSPIGWAQQVRAFAGNRWGVLALPLVTALVLSGVVYAVVPRRDIGVGVLPPRAGAARAPAWLRSPTALAWRLQRGALIGWAIGVVVGAAVFGSIANGIGDLVGASAQSRQLFERLGGSSALVQAFLAALAGIFGMAVSLYGVQALMRLRTEETAQRADPVLATHVSRLRWIASHLVFAFGGTAAILLLGGVAMGTTYGMRSGHVAASITDLVRSTAAQIPATWLIISIGVALFGLLPRRTIAVWGVAGLALAISLLGPVANLPRPILDLSPFGHIPKLPAAPLDATPLIALTLISAAAVGVGLAGFRRRDIG